jgi:hypothetical protein
MTVVFKRKARLAQVLYDSIGRGVILYGCDQEVKLLRGETEAKGSARGADGIYLRRGVAVCGSMESNRLSLAIFGVMAQEH